MKCITPVGDIVTCFLFPQNGTIPAVHTYNRALEEVGGGQGGGGGGIFLGIGLERGQGRPHHPREIWETLRAPKARKLVGDTCPLRLELTHSLFSMTR